MSVPVFDDCRTLRRKINAYLATGVKKTHFLKWIGGSSAVSLKNFLSKTGIMDGANMDIYYQLYLPWWRKGLIVGIFSSRRWGFLRARRRRNWDSSKRRLFEAAEICGLWKGLAFGWWMETIRNMMNWEGLSLSARAEGDKFSIEFRLWTPALGMINFALYFRSFLSQATI
jgi:hypothetical protein